MKQSPETVTLSDDQYNELIERVEKRALSENDWKMLALLLRGYGFLLATLRYQKTTVQKLKDLLFGKRTEKDPSKDQDDDTPSSSPGDPGPNPPAKEVIVNQSLTAPATASDSIGSEVVEPEDEEKEKAPGHGRRGHWSWKNALVFFYSHTLKVGNSCPKCLDGVLHAYQKPAVWVRFTGQAPLASEVHNLERLRCGSCTEVFTATPPEDLRRHPNATPEARATAAIVKYQAAVPFNRFENIQKNFGHPIPRTWIYDLCKEMADYLACIFSALKKLAAQGSLFQNDDTTVRILELMKENKVAKAAGTPLDRCGMFTTGLISQVGKNKIYLFFNSRKHAGENLADILDMRDDHHSPPTQVCDASDMNTTLGKHKTEVGGCHDHARRKFFEIRESFPRSCQYALDEWKIIDHTDAVAKKKEFSPEERLLLHQLNSKAAVERLHAWCTRMITEKQVDPRGHLAKAMQYYLNNDQELTLFLRRPDVPIANAACERCLKIPIGVRKTAYFYQTLLGAKVGDTIFSLMATAEAAGANYYHYLVAVQNHAEEVKRAPELWFPWNYQLQLV